jgi:hypothetical protein
MHFTGIGYFWHYFLEKTSYLWTIVQIVVWGGGRNIVSIYDKQVLGITVWSLLFLSVFPLSLPKALGSLSTEKGLLQPVQGFISACELHSLCSLPYPQYCRELELRLDSFFLQWMSDRNELLAFFSQSRRQVLEESNGPALDLDLIVPMCRQNVVW